MTVGRNLVRGNAVGPAGGVSDAPLPEERTRVLVVDDDERNLLAIQTVLEEIADVVPARSGEEALRHLLKGEFAVILLDVFMPGLDGYETAQLIRTREQSKRIPIIFLTAVNKENDHLLRGYSMGAVDYVFKPVEPLVLQSKVAVFVDLYEKTREIQRKAELEQRLLDENLRVNTEKLLAEQALRRAEERQAAIIQSLPIILYLEPVDANPRMPQFVSGNFVALTGFDFEHVRQNPNIWLERLHEEDRDRVMAALANRARGGSSSVEYRWLCADGQYKHFLDQAVLLRDASGEPTEFAGTLLDVTDRKLLEGQLVQAQKMDAIGKLTGGIAHDFNNLLAAVLGGIGLIERRAALDEPTTKILAMTRHAADQGAELVRRLLAFARRQQLQPASVRLSGLASTMDELMTHTLGGLVTLDWRLGDDLWPAFADEAQLELALMNLVINARDAMPDGGVIRIEGVNRSIDFGGELGLTPGDYVVIAVADTGSGIAPDILDRVLEPFFTTKEVGKGTGLGLSMVYGFAQQSGGTIHIESALDVGTRIEIWLPRAPGEEIAVGTRPRCEAGTPERTQSLRVLLVDDHPEVRATTAAILEELGHSVVDAAGGAEALEILERDPDAVDLVVTDYAMPVVSGTDVIRLARERRPWLPAIIVTGYADMTMVASRAADVSVLAKPFTPDQLDRTIRELVKESATVA